MDKRIEVLVKNWQKRNIQGLYCPHKEEAKQKLLEMIPVATTVGICGSQTLEQLGIVTLLESRGDKVFNQYKPGISREENLDLRKSGVQADYYLTSANAVSENGELVFLSAYGQRTAGISNAKNVIVVCGINKLVPNLEQALKRAREYAAPLNCKRLNWDTPCVQSGACVNQACLSPEFKRMCCQVLIIEAEAAPDRLRVVLVDENLGF